MNSRPSPFLRATAAFVLLAQLNVALPILPAAMAADRALPSPASSAAGLTPVLVEPPVTRTPERVKVRRATPSPAQPAASAPPDLIHAGVFSQPLLPLAATHADDDAALNAALALYKAKVDVSRFAPIEQYLQKNSASPYKAALQLNLGLNYYTSAYFSKALLAYHEAWQNAKNDKTNNGRIIADRAFGELVYLHSRLGHFDELKPLFAEAEGREFRGAATELVAGARQGLATMLHRPEIAFRCGPAALSCILRHQRSNQSLPLPIAEAKSTPQGIHLAEVQQIAQKSGMDMQIAFRSPGAPLLFPSVIHWKVGHFASLLENSGGINLLQDPTFNATYSASTQAIDSEASGYFLVPSGSLPAGWRPVDAAEASQIWGKGQPDTNDPDRTRESDKKIPECQSSRGPSNRGMAMPSVHAMVCSLSISDTPVGYQTPYGPSVYFRATYNQREAKQPAVFNFSNLGNKWTTNTLAYISFVTIYYYLGSLAVTRDYPIVHLPGGGTEAYIPTVPSHTAPLPVEPTSRCWMTKLPDGSWVRNSPDGSKMIFQAMPGVQVPGKIYMAGGSLDTTYQGFFIRQNIDTDGNALTYTYDQPTVNSAPAARLLAITDATGLVTSFAYDHASDPLKITAVEDPFGRAAYFSYDVDLRLTSITDTIGITSQFGYQGAGDFISSLTTPYGTSTFAYGEEGTGRWLELTDPQGDKERLEYPPYFTNATFPNAHPGFPNSAAPTGMTTSYWTHTVTYYWDKKAMREAPRKPESAKQYSWLMSKFSANTASGTLGAEKRAFENPVYYNYQNQTDSRYEGDFAQPLKVGRVLDDGTSQVYQYAYNPLGYVAKSTDPLGRETSYIYDENSASPGYNIDVREIRQKTGPNPEDYAVLSRIDYDAQHRPLTVTDAAGQTTTYTYNGAGQPTTITNAKGEITTFWYHRTGNPSDPTFPYNPAAPRDPAATGYLVRVDGPLPGLSDSVALTYDGFGRPRTTTDTEGYTLTTDYDAFDRPSAVTYPDGTYEQYIYERLDLKQSRDRQGRWSQFRYNPIRQLTLAQDPLQRITQYLWCKCGGLRQLIDPLGQITEWTHDVAGRVTAKTYHDGTQIRYTFENTTSRIKAVTDARGQVTRYAYFNDNSLNQVSYTDLAGAPLVPATPSVSYTYETFFPRVSTMTDGLGLTSYAYNPIPTTPTLGAGRLATIDGPWANDTIGFTYDELGRPLSRSINGPANTEAMVYDTLGRIQNTTNALGTFNYAYLGATGQLTRLDYPNGQRTDFAYHPNTAPTATGNGDRRLRQIQNLKPGGLNLSTFDYTYEIAGQIKTWATTNDATSTLTDAFKYDAVDQLIEAQQPSSPSTIKNHLYRYDRAGNRTSEQIDNAVTSATHNSVNQLTARSATGPIRIAGTLNEAATVTVNGQPATVTSANAFSADVTLAPGTQNITVAAKDYSNNTKTQNYQVTITGGTPRTLAYDLNGNLNDDGAGQTYQWDAANRLIKITRGSTVTEFVYNGAGQRVIEKLNGTEIKRWLWAGGYQPAEERDPANNVTKRFFSGLGEQIGGVNYFHTSDHLGSVREMTDSSGAVRARYDYDPYGRITKVSGDLEADFGFTGFYRHQTSGLNLTLYRAYNAELGRWLSRDVLEDAEMLPEGPNLYAYVANNPINWIDPLGLETFQDFMRKRSPSEISKAERQFKEQTKYIREKLKDPNLRGPQRDALLKNFKTMTQRIRTIQNARMLRLTKRGLFWGYVGLFLLTCPGDSYHKPEEDQEDFIFIDDLPIDEIPWNAV
jgi:RHS repeat-associated protein